MEDLATNLDAIRLAERLQGARAEEYWLHLEAEGPLEKYPAKQHARRVRERLGVAEGLIYLPGAPARSNEDSDMPAPFRQRRYFYYLSGCNEASCQLAYDIKRDILTLFIPRINPDRVFWNGRGSTPAEALDKYDIDEVFYADQTESWIHDWFLHYRYDGAQRLYILHKEQMPPLRYPWPVDSTLLQPAVNHCRMIKDDHEIKLIRKANDISSKAHKQILANITRFHNEAQVEGLFLNVCISNQAKQQAYDPIAASGPNAGTLHYEANNEDFADRQLMCLDAGCEFELYASDITRTFPLSGSWPSKEAENIYKLVERMQEACIQRLAPGVRYLDVHILAHQIAIDGLLELGLLHNGTREEIYKAGTSKAFFPHGLGHHVGLEVHDVGQQELMSLRKYPKYEKIPSLYPEDFHLPIYDKDLCMAPTDPQSPQLEEGMVVTVEPGIYFSAYALSYFYLPSPVHAKYINTEVLYRYFPVGGVRIEDDILITSKGYENLTTAPKGDAMLAIIKGQNTSSTLKCREKRIDTLEEPLRRAPGISRRVADPSAKPNSRTATEPIMNTGRENSRDQALQDHWLFRDTLTPPPSTGNSSKEKARHTERHTAHTPQDTRVPLCGTSPEDVDHIFMGWQSDSAKSAASPYLEIGMKTKVPRCQTCMVLSETVDRLRKTLSCSTTNSPSTSLKRDTGGLEDLNIRPCIKVVNNDLPSTKPKVPEVQQIPDFPPESLVDRPLHELFAPGHGNSSLSFGAPRGMNKASRGKLGNNVVPPPQVKAQRRSVTFDRYSIMQPQLPSNHDEIGPSPIDPHTKSIDHATLAQNKRASQPVYDYPKSERAVSEIPNLVPVSKWTFNTLPEQVYPSTAREASISSKALAGKHPSPAIERSNERERYVHTASSLRHPNAQRSLPFLLQGSASRMPGEGLASVRSPSAEESINWQNRQPTFVPVDLSAQEHGLRRRRSMGSALKPSMQSHDVSPLQSHPDAYPPSTAAVVSRAQAIAHWNDRVSSSTAAAEVAPLSCQRSSERANIHATLPPQGYEKEMRTMYSRARPGGEELQGVDYMRW